MNSSTLGIVLVVAIAAGGSYAASKYLGVGCCAHGMGGQESKALGTTPAPDDAALIASQGYCPVRPGTRLGEMGDPIKVMVAGKDGAEQPVFVCCKGCTRKVLAAPEQMLAKVAEMRSTSGATSK